MTTSSQQLRVTEHDYEWHPKYFPMVTGLFCGLYIITVAISPKLVDIFGWILPAGILTFPLCCIITDLLTEIYGFNRTRIAIWTALACTMIYGFITQAAILLKPASFWPHQQAFEAIFSTSIRMSVAGCCAWVVGEFANSFVLSRMKILQSAKGMSIRFVASTIVGQFLDTMVVILIAFAGTYAWKDLGVMFLCSWSAKVIYEIVALPLSIPVTKWVKRKEGIEHYDRQSLHVI